MGHYVGYQVFKKNESSRNIEAARNEAFRRNGGEYGGESYRLSDKVFDSYEEAVEYIENHTGTYDDLGVLFKEYKGKSKTMETLSEKRSKTFKEKEEFIQNNHVTNRKSASITCPKCGSRFNLDYVRAHGIVGNIDHCRLCGEDMRSETVLNRIKAFDTKIKDIDKKYAETEKKQKYEIKRVIKLEFHV